MSLQAPSLSMRDLQAVADAAVVAAEAFVAESKLAPTFADVASDMATSDAATGFMQVAEAAGADPVENVRLVEPSSGSALEAATALRAGASDALRALEERQLSDEAVYRSISASFQQLAA